MITETRVEPTPPERQIAGQLAELGFKFIEHPERGVITAQRRLVIDRDDLTVVIPAIPPRVSDLLVESLTSVGDQKRGAEAVIVALDHDGEGDVPTRRKGLEHVHTEWIAWFDDDDVMFPEHLGMLMGEASGGVGFVSSEYEADGMRTPSQDGGVLWPHCLIRTRLVRESVAQGDWGCLTGAWRALWNRAEEQGLRRVHVPKPTWRWRSIRSDELGHTQGLSWTKPQKIAEYRRLLRRSPAAAVQFWRDEQGLPDRPELELADAQMSSSDLDAVSPLARFAIGGGHPLFPLVRSIPSSGFFPSFGRRPPP